MTGVQSERKIITTMAKNLLEKLNLLLQANLTSVTPDLTRLSPRRAGKNLDKEIAALRKQLEVADQDEVSIQTQIEKLTQTILQWDAEANSALQKGQEAQARYALQQMETEKRRLVMLQSELDEHRQTMAALMRQLNQFESVLQAAQQTQPVAEEETETLSDAIRRTRETIEAETTSMQNEIDVVIDEAQIERELASRRSRLAKPDA